MQYLEKRDKRRGFGRTQILPVGRHVTAPLNHLANELVLREPHCNAVECWTSLPAKFTERMAIAALFDLKHESPFSLKRGRAVQK
jgi:hypothetical protein